MGLVVAICCFTTFAEAAPLEEGAQYESGWTPEHAQAIANDVSYLIKQAGYRCDTVSSVLKWFWGVGFNVNCNNHRYSYEIEDQGGNWVAKLK